MLCVLSCSLFHTGRFGIGDARVVVERDDRNQRFRVRITETCTACGECAQACAYGVIGLEE
jgi:NAD-dependent dihydropyrimidine dehydrogenase PreA subunit